MRATADNAAPWRVELARNKAAWEQARRAGSHPMDHRRDRDENKARIFGD